MEAVTGGYGRRVWLIWRDSDADWRSTLIQEEGERIHHIAGGDIDGEPGVELITVGFAGEVVMLKPR
jgi:hypothetical protein